MRIFQQSLALPSFHPTSALHCHDARQALRLACMEASLTPTCAGQTQAWSHGRLMSLLLQSSTAPEARRHQFHLPHLCQQMMDPRDQPYCALNIHQKEDTHPQWVEPEWASLKIGYIRIQYIICWQCHTLGAHPPPSDTPTSIHSFAKSLFLMAKIHFFNMFQGWNEVELL